MTNASCARFVPRHAMALRVCNRGFRVRWVSGQLSRIPEDRRFPDRLSPGKLGRSHILRYPVAQPSRGALQRTWSATLDTEIERKGAFFTGGTMSLFRTKSRRASSLPRSLPGREVGRIVALWRYPVKSMAAEALGEAELSWHGLAGDRRWAFIRDGKQRSGFPWLTIRERPAMAHYRPRLAQPDQPDRSPTVVRTPAGTDLDVVDPALAAELGDGVRVIKQDRGVFDTLPLSLITTRTVALLGARVGAPLDVQRFRPNLVVAATGRAAFPEDRWVGGVLRIGEAWVRVDKRDKRCVLVNVDPTTTRRDPAILRAIVAERAACLGVYGSVVRPGRVAVGDAVILEPGPEPVLASTR